LVIKKRTKKPLSQKTLTRRKRVAFLKKTDPYLLKSRRIRSQLYRRFPKGHPLKASTPTQAEILVWLKSQEIKCYYSGAPLTLDTIQIDHKIPVARGGSNILSNLCISSAHMNLIKGSMTDYEFKSLLALASTWEDRGEGLFRRLKQGHF